MRIAVAVHGYPPAAGGGVERVAFEQAEALAERGHEVHVFAAGGGDTSADGTTRDETVGRARVRRVSVANRARSPFSEYYEGGFLDDAFRAFLREHEPDVLHVQHLVTLSLRLIDVAEEEGVPVVVSLHDAFYLCHRLFLLDASGERCPGPDAGLRCVPCLAEHGVGAVVQERFDAMARRLARVAAIVAPSVSLGRRYETELPFLSGRIEVLEPGLARIPSPRPLRERRPGEPLRLGFVGTLAPHKGLDVLLDALATQPLGAFSLRIHGPDGIRDDAWVARLRDRSAGQAVEWCGTFDGADVDEVLGSVDVLVLPSRCDESWSRVVREARALGRAVIAPNSGGPADWLDDGRTALLVEPGSVESLGAALTRVRNEPGLLAQLSEPATNLPRVADSAEALAALFERVRAPSRASPIRVTVAYVTKNGEAWIEESVRAVRAQRGDFELVEILAIDSSSTDGTVDALRRHGVRVVTISPEEFGHGRTRNRAAEEASGDVVVFLTQDAAPADEKWLECLLAPLRVDPLCAATWSRHVPRPDCHPMEWRILAEHPPFLPDAPSVQSGRGNPAYVSDPEGQCVLSNNSAAYRRELLLRWPFPDVAFAEDRAWARAVLDAGWRTALARDSIVRHSHAYPAWLNLRRNFDHWQALSREPGHADTFSLWDGWRASFRETRRDLRFWSDHTGRGSLEVGLRWGPTALLYHLGAFTGRWLGSRSDRLPAGVPERLSLHPAPVGGNEES